MKKILTTLLVFHSVLVSALAAVETVCVGDFAVDPNSRNAVAGVRKVLEACRGAIGLNMEDT